MISDSIRKPGSYSKIVKGAGGGLPSRRMEMLIIAPRLGSSSVAAGAPTRVFSADQAAHSFGAGSIMHRMAMAAFRQFAQVSLTCCAVDDTAAGVAASASISFTGSAAATGTFTLWVGTDRITIRVDKGDTVADVVEALTNEINNNHPNLPVTASHTSGTVVLTAKNKGTIGNSLGQKGHPAISVDVDGVSATTTTYSGGAGDADLSTALAKVAGERYHLIVIPYTNIDAAQTLSEHVTMVSDEINQLGARGFMFLDGNFAATYTFARSINDKRMNVGYIYGAKRHSFENAAAMAAMLAAQDAPWRAVNDEPLIGCDAPEIPDRFMWNEIDTLLWNGITPFEVGTGERVRCVRAISTYIKSDSGAEDDTFLDTHKIATADYVRDAVRTRHSNDFKNKILRDNHVPGEPPGIITAEDVRLTNLDVCRRIEREGGLNDVEAFEEQFTSVRNPNAPGRVDSVIPIDIVDAAHIMANTIMITSTL
ncbi:MAG: phage tail sheath subtilisin-like domain-containing protein [Chitinispirillia bacterium]|nr:phage tail sheath subtilisin-like domain-containing protein [Chitinispirillia bacterium]